MSEQLPYYCTKEGIQPPWFNKKGHFDPKRYDASIPFTPRGTTYSLPLNPNKQFENPYDLDNLRIIDPAEVQRALRELEEANVVQPRPSVCVLATGGTIASAMSKEGELVASVDIQTIFDFIPSTYR